jgi:hypothetical protein
MPTAPGQVVLLIPGFFGYGAFGPADKPFLEYFAGVKEALQRKLPADYAILVHEPPPTGSLDERVASLHEALRKLRHGERLPHSDAGVTAASVHLVGHSTGGLDARLLANPKFHWVGGPRGSERSEVIRSIGKIVTISAPLKGTPLVRHVRPLRDAVLDGVQILTLLGIFRNSEIDSLVLQWLTAGTGSLWRSPVFGALPFEIVSQAARRAVPSDVPNRNGDEVAAQVKRFLEKIQEDRQLFEDLSVDNMARLNAEIAGGDSTSIISYVTVSPKPSLIDIGLDPLGRAVYQILYLATARDPLPGPPPAGRPLGAAKDVIGLVSEEVSCDGVVPARSQTLDGSPARIVLADHLDVVGSFQGGTGADVMRSHADFNKTSFAELWWDVADRIALRQGA